jgi:hypothetical protein
VTVPRLADLAGRAPNCIEIPLSPDAVAWGLARVRDWSLGSSGRNVFPASSIR